LKDEIEKTSIRKISWVSPGIKPESWDWNNRIERKLK